MKDINKIVEQESLKVFPVVTNVKGGDCNKTYREDWVRACNKGVQIMKEMMESLKDFETWKEWRNTDPVVEWDDSHELSNVMNDMLAEVFPEFTLSKGVFDYVSSLNEWEQIPFDSALYDGVLFKTQELTPIDSGNSLHCHHADYDLDGTIYRLTWEIGNNNNPTIEFKIN